MKLVATMVFCSFCGFDNENRNVSDGYRILDGEEMKTLETAILEQAREFNSEVERVNILAITPLEFETVDDR